MGKEVFKLRFGLCSHCSRNFGSQKDGNLNPCSATESCVNVGNFLTFSALASASYVDNDKPSVKKLLWEVSEIISVNHLIQNLAHITKHWFLIPAQLTDLFGCLATVHNFPEIYELKKKKCNIAEMIIKEFTMLCNRAWSQGKYHCNWDLISFCR